MNYFGKLNKFSEVSPIVSDVEKVPKLITNNSIVNILCIVVLVFLVLLLVWCLCKKNESKSDHSKEENFSNKSLEEGCDKIYVFIMNGCGYCTLLKDLLKSNNNKIGEYCVEFLEQGTEEAKKIMEKYNLEVKGFPTLYCPTTNKTSVGFGGTIEKLIKDLKIK